MKALVVLTGVLALGIVSTGAPPFAPPAVASPELRVPGQWGAAALVVFGELVGHEIDQERLIRAYRQYPGNRLPIAQVRQAATELGLSLVGINASLDDLAQRDRPCLIHLNHPDRLVVLVDVHPSIVRLFEGGCIRVRPRQELSELMSGYVWITDRQDTGSDPRCRFDATHLVLPQVRPGQKVEHVFDFHNDGAEDLIVSVLRKSCSCGDVLVEGGVLRPGQQGKVILSYTGGGGTPVLETVTLKTNDPFRPRIILSIRAGGAQAAP